VSGNSAAFGGGVYSDASFSGPKTTITNSTMSGNSATGAGGGIYNARGLSVVENSTVTANAAPSGKGSGVAGFGYTDTRTEVRSTIVAANANTDADFTPGTTNSFDSKGYNLIGDGNATVAFGQEGDQSEVGDPKLGLLTDNGGPTKTHALLAGSPAIDQGKSFGTSTDQRGKPRPFDLANVDNAPDRDGSDIGAFELNNRQPTVVADSYTINEDITLTTDRSTGVLSNDTDADNDTLTAELVDYVDHGTLTLNPDGSFSYTPNADYDGEDSFTYKANDGTDDSNEATVNITINPGNDVPGFTKGADQTVNEDAGAQSVTGWAKDVSAGPPDESSQKVSFKLTNDNNSLFTASGQPKISPGGTLTYTPAKDANGRATVTVKATDDGGTANGGVDTSAAQTFTITVNPVNDAPTVEVAAGGQCGTSGTSGQINLTVADVESAPGALTLSATSSNQNLVPNSGLSVDGSGANHTLTVTAASRRSGTATMTVRASDGQSSGTVLVTVKVGSDLSDTLGGTSGADIVFGKNGANTTTGQGGNDFLCGGNGPDAMSGGSGDDTLDGANGNDAPRGDAGKDILRGSAGDDTLTGGTEADSFDGGSGTDKATDFNTTEGDSRKNIP
jgi:VCBS repeat-containing protein